MRAGRSPPIEYAHREASQMPLGKRFAAAVRVKPSNFVCTAAVLLLACVLLFRPCSLPMDPSRWQVLTYAQQVCRCSHLHRGRSALVVLLVSLGHCACFLAKTCHSGCGHLSTRACPGHSADAVSLLCALHKLSMLAARRNAATALHSGCVSSCSLPRRDREGLRRRRVPCCVITLDPPRA